MSGAECPAEYMGRRSVPNVTIAPEVNQPRYSRLGFIF